MYIISYHIHIDVMCVFSQAYCVNSWYVFLYICYIHVHTCIFCTHITTSHIFFKQSLTFTCASDLVCGVHSSDVAMTVRQIAHVKTPLVSYLEKRKEEKCIHTYIYMYIYIIIQICTSQKNV